VLIAIIDIISYLTVALLTIPAWLDFFISSLGSLGDIGQ
jgi:hypothetical protein